MTDGVRKRLWAQEQGFTLPEVLVTTIIMVVVLFALYGIFDMSLRSFAVGNDKVEALENARIGLEKMEREIRGAYPYNKGGGDAHLFDTGTWTATQIRFGNELDGSRTIECPNAGVPPRCEIISYQVYQPAGSTTYALGRANSVAGTPEPVVEYVDYASPTDTGLRFRYFQRDGTTEILPGGNEAQIGMVRIELRIEVPNEFGNDATQTLTTDVALRNRGD